MIRSTFRTRDLAQTERRDVNPKSDHVTLVHNALLPLMLSPSTALRYAQDARENIALRVRKCMNLLWFDLGHASTTRR